MHTYKNPVFLMDHEALKTSEESANLSGGSISHSNTLEPPAPDSTTTSEEKDEATIAGSSTDQGDKCPVQPVNDSTERESANALQNTNEQDFEQSNQPDEFLIKSSRFRNFVRVLQRISDSKWMLVIFLCMMAFFISNIYVGGSHLTKCPANPTAPLLVLINGIMGTMTILSYLVVKATKSFYQPKITLILRWIAIMFLACTVTCAVLEAISVPSTFDDAATSNEEYCGESDKFRSSATKLVSLSFKYINSPMPPRGKELSKDLKDEIIKLYKESKSQSQITKIIGKSPATVQKIIEKFQADGNTLNKPRTGRPSIFTDRERRIIVGNVKKIRRLAHQN
ncbi:hypothetical protein TNCT_515841 [Trichonephila clavata]|uniref:Uncharacterized protein n=1 Tax=Trichonephila clavata TaxID=2740835 RepID=A0A8X6LSR3_TRICU|nr:hypothetical protein TNCT_515841 [Trichonephila clavata]